MSQFSLESEISQLDRKVQLLLGNIKNLKKEISELKEENNELKSRLKEKELQVDIFQNKIKISTIANGMAGLENMDEVRAQIDAYIGEIDKCIAYLSS